MWLRRWIQRIVEELMKAQVARWEALEQEVYQEIQIFREAVREYDKTIEETQERIDRGNKIWRKIRAREKYQEIRAEEEGWDDELPESDAGGSEGQGMLALHPGVEGLSRPEPGWEEKKRALNRRLAGLE